MGKQNFEDGVENTGPQYSVTDVAALVGVSSDTVRRWADEGKIISARDGAGKIRIDGASLAKYVQKRGAESGLENVDHSGATRSLRNNLVGIITKITSDKVMSQVEIQCGPYRMVSLISTEAVEDMELQVGKTAVAVAKATNVSIQLPS